MFAVIIAWGQAHAVGLAVFTAIASAIYSGEKVVEGAIDLGVKVETVINREGGEHDRTGNARRARDEGAEGNADLPSE